MADKKKIVNIQATVDSAKAEADLRSLAKEAERLNDENVIIDTATDAANTTRDIKSLGEETKKTTKVSEDLESQSKKTGKSFKVLKGVSNIASKGIKGVGLAMKAAGIGLVVAAFAALASVMSQNQAVMDGVSKVANIIQLGFNAVTTAVSNAYKKVSEATDGFDAMKKVIKGLMTIYMTPLKLAFYEIKAAIQAANLAYQKIFGDNESVKAAKNELLETAKAIAEVADDAVNAGKDIVSNFKEAVLEVSEGVSVLSDELGNIDGSAIVEQADNMVKLKNNALLAAAAQAGLVEEYSRQAEQLRQLRDDDRKSIDERIEANNKLKQTLENQSKAMLSQADAQIASAQANLKANDSVENQVALQEALNNKKAVEAQIEGFISEQKANNVALDKERIDLNNSIAESDNRLAINKKKNTANEIEDDRMRFDSLKAIYEEEKALELERLESKRNSYLEGTQAWVDAQEELRAKQQEYRERDKELEAEDKDLKLEQLELDKEFENLSFEEQRQVLQERAALLAEDDTLNEEQKLALQEKYADARNKSVEAEEKAKQAIREQAFQTAEKLVGFVKSLAGKNKAVQKAALIAESGLGIAQMIIKNNQANIAALATPQAVASFGASAAPVIAMNNVTTGIGVAASIKATADGLKAIGAGGSAKGGGGRGGATLSSASGAKAAQLQAADSSFDSVGEQVGSERRLGQSVADAQSDSPVRAYVTSTDIASGAQFERNRVDVAGF